MWQFLTTLPNSLISPIEQELDQSPFENLTTTWTKECINLQTKDNYSSPQCPNVETKSLSQRDNFDHSWPIDIKKLDLKWTMQKTTRSSYTTRFLSWLKDHYTKVESINMESNSFTKSWNCLLWRESIKEEYNSIIKNKVWYLIKLPLGKTTTSIQWIFKAKINHWWWSSKVKIKACCPQFLTTRWSGYRRNIDTNSCMENH